MDWNHDGKVDRRDDDYFYHVILPEEEAFTSSTPSPVRTPGSTPVGSVLLPLIYLGALLPGTIPINGFTMLVGLVCAGILFVKFIKWLF